MRFLAILLFVAAVFYLSGCGLFKDKTESVKTASYMQSVNDSANLKQNDSLQAKITRETNIASIELGSFSTTHYFKPNTPTTFNPDGSFTGSVDSSKTTGQTNKNIKANEKAKADILAGSKADFEQGRSEETANNVSDQKNESKPPNWLIISLILVAVLVVVIMIVKVFKT